MFKESKILEFPRYRNSAGVIIKILPKVLIVDDTYGEREYTFVLEGAELEAILDIEDKIAQRDAFIEWVKPIVSFYHTKWMEEVEPIVDTLDEESLISMFGTNKIDSLEPAAVPVGQSQEIPTTPSPSIV